MAAMARRPRRVRPVSQEEMDVPSEALVARKAAVKKLLRDAASCMESRQWEAARAHAHAAGLEAERAGLFTGMRQAGAYLERLDALALSGHFLAAAGRLQVATRLPEWDGSVLTDRTLLIVQRIRHIGGPIRLARLIPLAAARARRCIVFAEPRLVPLFRRSFPQVEVREGGPVEAEACEEADAVASYETLTKYLAGDERARLAGFTPLRPDCGLVNEFRSKYHRDGRPLIGMTWTSTNEKKDLPALTDWAAMMRRFDATYVSLQYGEVSGDVKELCALSGAELIHDETVDSLIDLDRFAAQIVAMDAVLTISNTGAHLAGALGVPMIVILDDNNHLVWPAHGAHMAWYPAARLVRRRSREWQDVFAEVRDAADREFFGARASSQKSSGRRSRPEPELWGIGTGRVYSGTMKAVNAPSAVLPLTALFL
jgi:hypothetical protein